MRTHLAAKLLFDDVGPTSEPLFESAGHLAREITQLPEFAGKYRNTATFLSQILVQGARSCPQQLQSEIVEAVRRRLKGQPPELVAQWAYQVSRALEADNLTRGGNEPLTAKALYEELVFFAETASEHYIITSHPAEQVTSEYAFRLRGKLLERLNLTPADFGKADPTLPHYTFCLPSASDCKRWWSSVLSEIRARFKEQNKRPDIEAIGEHLSYLDTSDHLRLFEIPLIACGCPVVVFEPDSNTPTGFNLYYFSDASRLTWEVSVSKMDPDYLVDWKNFVHGPLESGQVKRTRVHFVE